MKDCWRKKKLFGFRCLRRGDLREREICTGVLRGVSDAKLQLVCIIIIARPRWSGTSPVGRQLPSRQVAARRATRILFCIISLKTYIFVFCSRTPTNAALVCELTVCVKFYLCQMEWPRIVIYHSTIGCGEDFVLLDTHYKKALIFFWIRSTSKITNHQHHHVFLSGFYWPVERWRWKRLGWYWQFLQPSVILSHIPTSYWRSRQQILKDGIPHVCGRCLFVYLFLFFPG